MRVWKDMTPMEQMRASYSDFHKDVLGFRPDLIEVSSWSDEELVKEWEKLTLMDMDD